MAESAFQIQYRQEFIQGFEQTQSLVRSTVTTEAVIKGNQATFLVADSGGATAVTRGLNGLIPGRPDNNQQHTALLQEWHDKPIKTGFNVFASQGDQRRIMQETSMGVVNRKIDQDVIAELSTATLTTGPAVVTGLDLDTTMHALTILGNNDVPMDGNIFALITPAAHGFLMQQTSFSSADFVNNKPLTNMLVQYRWANINFIVHPNLPGKGTANEKLFVYHKTAIGHAVDRDGIMTNVGFNDEHDYSFALTTVYMGSKVLQNSGIVVINHNGSKYQPI